MDKFRIDPDKLMEKFDEIDHKIEAMNKEELLDKLIKLADVTYFLSCGIKASDNEYWIILLNLYFLERGLEKVKKLEVV